VCYILKHVCNILNECINSSIYATITYIQGGIINNIIILVSTAQLYYNYYKLFCYRENIQAPSKRNSLKLFKILLSRFASNVKSVVPGNIHSPAMEGILVWPLPPGLYLKIPVSVHTFHWNFGLKTPLPLRISITLLVGDMNIFWNYTGIFLALWEDSPQFYM